MNKTNLLFLGTTNYGFELSKSDENKFRELNEKFNVYVFTYGTVSYTHLTLPTIAVV